MGRTKQKSEKCKLVKRCYFVTKKSIVMINVRLHVAIPYSKLATFELHQKRDTHLNLKSLVIRFSIIKQEGTI